MKKYFYNSNRFAKYQRGFLGINWPPKTVLDWIVVIIGSGGIVALLIYAAIFGTASRDCRAQCDIDFTESQHSLDECYASCPPK